MKFTNIKPEIYNSIGIENNPYCISQPFQINSSSDATIDFFKGIYSYPPKIKLKFNKLDDFSRFKNLSTTLLLQDSTLAVNDGVRIPHLSSRLGKSAKQMEVIPAYVVLNGQQELVVSSSYSNNSEFHFLEVSKKMQWQKIYMCSLTISLPLSLKIVHYISRNVLNPMKHKKSVEQKSHAHKHFSLVVWTCPLVSMR